MAISLSCDCGRALRLKDELAGKRIRCPDCKAILTVPAGDAAADVESGFEVVEGGSDSHQAQAHERFRATDARPASAPAPPPRPPIQAEDDAPRKRRRRKSSSRSYYGDYEEPRRRGSPIVISPSIISGILMMIGAVVWFVLGLHFGWVFFYPPILFVLGLIAVVKGFMGYEED